VSKPRPMPTTWEELRMPQRHLMRFLATMEYDPDDLYELAKKVWPEKDHQAKAPHTGRYHIEWGLYHQLRYLRWYGFVEKTGPVFLTELGRKVYAERWDREIARLLEMRSFLSNSYCISMMHEPEESVEAEATDQQLAVAFAEWLDTDESLRYRSRAWENMAWNTQGDLGAPR
jgi:hypothetical protein